MSIAIQKKKLSINKDPDQYYQQISNIVDSNHESYLKTLSDFEVNFRKSASQTTLKSLKIVLEVFYRTVKNDEFLLTDLSKQGGMGLANSQNIFLVLKTIDIVNMLADYIIDRRSILLRSRRSFDLLEKVSSETRDVTLLCAKILKLFSIINSHFALILSNKQKFCIRMFELMLQENKVYFKQVIGIQEALIASNPEMINAQIYPHIQEALANMPKKYYARFSRVVALLVLENSDKTDFKELPSEYSENKMIKLHSFLLSIPNLIENYVIILEYLKEVMERLISTTAQNARKSMRYLKESNLIKDSGLNLSFLKPLFEQSQVSEVLASEIFTPKFIVKFITEILFVFSNLLVSKRKIEIQNKLRQINFIDRIIHPLFDLLFHPDLDKGNDEDHYLNGVYTSNPLATTRIQLLRIIINFCDRDSLNIANKETLLSSEEKVILCQLIQGTFQAHHNKAIDFGHCCKSKNFFNFNHLTSQEKNPQVPFFTEEILCQNAFANVQKKGLLNKIIMLFNRFEPNTNYRFWLSSCVESFLRGFHEPHQIFVAHTGFLYHLLGEILNNKITKSNNIQISFDLVGEIIKFNKYNMIFLEKLCEKYNWTDQLAEQALVNVVDSNVFLRALLLSFEKFDFIYKKEKNIFIKENVLNFNQQLKLYDRCAKEEKKWFHLIVEWIDPNLINQDNICCVNTVLMMATFADQREELEAYLDSLVVYNKENNKEKCISLTKSQLQSFKHALGIWQRYYMAKTKDRFSLQYTSSLPFYYLQEIREKLQNLVDNKIKSL